MAELETRYTPDVLNASYNPDSAILRGVLEDVRENISILSEPTAESEFNDIAVNRYLDEEMATKKILNGAYRIGGLTMNLIAKRTYDRDKKPLPKIIPQHAQLNRQIDPEIERRLDNDQTILDGRLVEFQYMKKEMRAFSEVPLVPNESSDLGKQFIAGIVDIANLYDYAAKYPPETFIVVE